MLRCSVGCITVVLCAACAIPPPQAERAAGGPRERDTAQKTLPAGVPTSAPAVRIPDDPRERARLFQAQELGLARPFGYIFNPGDPPQIIWRDVDTVRRLGGDGQVRVRWFDRELNESDRPTTPGRWGAYIESTAPNGTVVRRALTLCCRPPGFLVYFAPDNVAHVPQPPGGIPAEVWTERHVEVARVGKDLFFRAFNDSEAGAILLAGLTESATLGRPPRELESAAVLNDDYHLALKLKVLGRTDRVRPLAPPRRRAGEPAPVLRPGTPAEANVAPDAAARIAEVCRQWAEDSGVPFVTLVARHGVIVLHEAFGRGLDGRPIACDYRADVFSITKTVTAILFSQFVDQGLIGLDDSIATVFPDYPVDSPHVPTFRQCLTHMSGLTGHGDWGGVRNAYLDNIVLNGIDANEPGRAYVYSGMGFDLAAEAMELVTGKSALRLYHDHLFAPLRLGDVPMANASAGAQLTAWELAVLAQWLLNRGSYGELEFIAPSTFERLLPEPLSDRYPGVKESEGIGMHWMRDLRPGAQPGAPGGTFFSARTIGHGSFSACILRVDLDADLLVVQVRREGGPRFAEWAPRMFGAIADALRAAGDTR